MSLLRNVGVGVEVARVKQINDLIGDLLFPSPSVHSDATHPEWENYTGFKATDRAIRGSFRCPLQCVGPLTWDIIFTRLVIIDSLWSTNTRMGFFVKENVATALWKASEDSNGVPTDATLAAKADEYVQWAIGKGAKTQGAAEVEDLFAQKYPCYVGSNQNITGKHQWSLLSKYLHFLVETQMPQNTIGFPIYDNIVAKILPKVFDYALLKRSKCQSIKDYTHSLHVLIHHIQTTHPVWNTQIGVTPYHIIDRFLWTLGKVRRVTIKNESLTTLSYLVSQAEFKTIVTSGKLSPQLQPWADFLKKNNTYFK